MGEGRGAGGAEATPVRESSSASHSASGAVSQTLTFAILLPCLCHRDYFCMCELISDPVCLCVCIYIFIYLYIRACVFMLGSYTVQLISRSLGTIALCYRLLA